MSQRTESNSKVIFFVFAILATIMCGACMVLRIKNAVSFNVNCEQYIKRAANAGTVEMAKEELAQAISYAEEHDLTEGVVSIILHQPKNDIGYWYQNMKRSYEELEELPEEATALEKTNVLMKLRETLTDQKESSVSVTHPDGISIYPNNVLYCIWGVLSFIACVVLWMRVYLDDIW